MEKKNDAQDIKMNEEKKNKPVSFLFFLVFWVVVIGLGFLFFGKDLGFGLIVAAIISGILWYSTLNSQYSGVIEKIETKIYHEKNHIDREQKFAVLRLDNGKRKKIYYDPRWKIGDKIIKKKGENAPIIINK